MCAVELRRKEADIERRIVFARRCSRFSRSSCAIRAASLLLVQLLTDIDLGLAHVVPQRLRTPPAPRERPRPATGPAWRVSMTIRAPPSVNSSGYFLVPA